MNTMNRNVSRDSYFKQQSNAAKRSDLRGELQTVFPTYARAKRAIAPFEAARKYIKKQPATKNHVLGKKIKPFSPCILRGWPINDIDLSLDRVASRKRRHRR